MKRPVDQLLWMGHGFFHAGALMMLGLGLSGAGRPWGLPVLAFMPVMTLGNVFLLPLSMSAGVTTFRSTAGSASGLAESPKRAWSTPRPYGKDARTTPSW
ncbi:hypothetical protein [Streptomyces fagopyri]|uniref:hypothetical protein n=1 Tax=Streptomyces fagopyri TaxID=2662397 RepID=UPI003713ABB9